MNSTSEVVELEYINGVPKYYHKLEWMRESNLISTHRVSKQSARMIGAEPCKTCYRDLYSEYG